MYVMGEYRGGGPMYVSYEIQFEQEEVDRSWLRILAYKSQTAPEIH
jgi:hypothetical protein